MIELDGVAFGYAADDDVLCDLSLRLPRGLSLLLGPNGCGKSTLLKIAAGVEHPRRGRVTVAGHDMWTEEVEARRHLAYVPEHPDLTPYATLRDVLALVCGLRERPRVAADQALEWVGLSDLGHRTVRELSKGQRRRAVLAAARIGAPACLLLDEPLEGMDRAFAADIVRWIEEHVRDGGVALVVSHRFEALAELADRAITLHDGTCRLSEPLPATAAGRIAVLDELARGG